MISLDTSVTEFGLIAGVVELTRWYRFFRMLWSLTAWWVSGSHSLYDEKGETAIRTIAQSNVRRNRLRGAVSVMEEN